MSNKKGRRKRDEQLIATRRWDEIHGIVSNRQKRRALAAKERKAKR